MEELIQIRRQAIDLAHRATALRQMVESVQYDGRNIADSHYCKVMFADIEKISREIRRLNPFKS